MCGLCGAISTYLDPSEIAIVKELMVVSSLRGRYGSGVVAVPMKSSQSIRMAWTPESASAFAYDEHFNKQLKQKCCVVAVHARLPTSGGMDVEDNHPIRSKDGTGHIIGMHNGTMKTVNGVEVKDKEHDSKLLFDAIEDVGPEVALRNSEGAYALVWVDTRDRTLNFLRNTDRPLFFAYNEDFNGTLFWASEAGALNYVLRRNTWAPDGKLKISQPPAYRLWKFSLENSGRVNLKSDNKLDILRDKTSVPTVPTPTTVFEDIRDESLIKIMPNKFISASDFATLLAKNCCNCREPQEAEEHHRQRLKWFRSPQSSSFEYLCKKCYDNDPNARAYADVYSAEEVQLH